MSDQNTVELLQKLLKQFNRLPEEYSSPEFGIGVNQGVPASSPIEMRMAAQPEMRLRRSFETPLGYVGMSVGSEQGQPVSKLEYAKQLSALGGLLDVSANIGKGTKEASVSYQPSNVPMSVSGSINENQFGQLMKNLQAQYAQEIMKNLMLGIYGRVGTNPMYGITLEKRF